LTQGLMGRRKLVDRIW